MSDPILFIKGLVLALLLGSLIGLEREKNNQDKDLHEFGGIRTLTLTAVFSYLLFTLFADQTLFLALFSAIFGVLVVASYVMSAKVYKNLGATTELATLFVYFLGILVAQEEVLIAAVVTLTVVLLLYFKQSLHRFARKVDRTELYDTIKFVATVFVILPLLPNETFGPLEVLNPYTIWLVVVLVSSISFVSYVAIKFLGAKRGIGLAGFFGGLISSTAVSMSFSQMSRKSKRIVNPFVFAIVVSSAAMFFRVLVEVSVLNAALLDWLLIPLLAMGVTGLLIAFYTWGSARGKKTKYKEKDLHLKSPFQLWPAIQFGLLFAALLLISKLANDAFGDQGLYLTAFLSGGVDVDAITVSMANLSKNGEIASETAANAVVIAAVTNTFAKGMIAFSFASRGVAVRCLLAMLAMIAVGLATLFLI